MVVEACRSLLAAAMNNPIPECCVESTCSMESRL